MHCKLKCKSRRVRSSMELGYSACAPTERWTPFEALMSQVRALSLSLIRLHQFARTKVRSLRKSSLAACSFILCSLALIWLACCLLSHFKPQKHQQRELDFCNRNKSEQTNKRNNEKSRLTILDSSAFFLSLFSADQCCSAHAL